MAQQCQNQFGVPPTDKYANPTRRTDEYGNQVGPRLDKFENPLGHHGATPIGTAASSGKYGPPDTTTDTGPEHQHNHHREKEMMDKIKEKLPGTGGHNRDEVDDLYSSHSPKTPTTTPYGGGTVYPGSESSDHREKKGIMDKIKEKLTETE